MEAQIDFHSLQMVNVLLSVATVVLPVLFGFVMYKMSGSFVTKELFEAYKILAASERQSMNDRLGRIEKNTDELLRRDND